MKLGKRIFALITLLFVVSCASYNPGEFALVKNGKSDGLIVKGELVRGYATDHFILVNIGFENKSDEWKRFKYIEMVSTDSIKDAKIVVGKDLVTWSESMKSKLSIDNHNRAVLVGTIASVAAIGSAAAGGNGDFQTGTALAGGAAALLTFEAFNDLSKRANNLEMSQLVPPSHLYNPFSVAPGLVTKKWILLQIKKDHIPCFIDFELTDYTESKTHYRLDLDVCLSGSYKL